MKPVLLRNKAWDCSMTPQQQTHAYWVSCSGSLQSSVATWKQASVAERPYIYCYISKENELTLTCVTTLY